MTTANNNTSIFKVTSLSSKDIMIGNIRMALWRVRKFLRLQPLHYMKWRVRKAFQRKPKYYKDYIIRVK